MSRKSDFYYNLGVMLEAGLGILNVFERKMPGLSGGVAHRVHARMLSGATFPDAIASEKSFSQFEKTLIKVAVQTGTLPMVAKTLSEWFQMRDGIRKKIICAMLYPLFVYHFACVIFLVVDIFSKTCSLSESVVKMALFMGAPWVLMILFKNLHSVLESIGVIGVLPIFGDLQFKLETTFFYQVLGISLNTGIGAVDSLKLAASCCKSRMYANHYNRIADVVRERNCPITEGMAFNQLWRESSSVIPGMLAAAEQSGTLPECCERISKMQMSSAQTKINILTAIFPIVIFLAVALVIAVKIIGFYASYFSQINDLL